MAAKSKATKRRAAKKGVAKATMKKIKGGIIMDGPATFKGSPTKPLGSGSGS